MEPQDQDPRQDQNEPQSADTGPDTDRPEEPDTFPRAYVEQLRREAAEHRKKAAQVDTMREALQAAYLRLGTQGILHDPEALAWSDDFTGEDGVPDLERIRAA